MRDEDAHVALAVLRALHLNAWREKLDKRLKVVGDFEESLDRLEADITTNGEAQRQRTISELDHLKEIIDGKKEQLLSKGKLEMQNKLDLVEGSRRRLDPEATRTRELRKRVERVQMVNSSTMFLGVCGSTILDLREHLGGVQSLALPATAQFRTFTVESAHRALGNLDLGPYPNTATRGHRGSNPGVLVQVQTSLPPPSMAMQDQAPTSLGWAAHMPQEGQARSKYLPQSASGAPLLPAHQGLQYAPQGVQVAMQQPQQPQQQLQQSQQQQQMQQSQQPQPQRQPSTPMSASVQAQQQLKQPQFMPPNPGWPAEMAPAGNAHESMRLSSR